MYLSKVLHKKSCLYELEKSKASPMTIIRRYFIVFLMLKEWIVFYKRDVENVHLSVALKFL